LSPGELLDGANRPEEAIACYLEAVSQRPEFAHAWAGMADAMRAFGRFSQAIECYSKAIAISPELGQAHRGLANSRRKTTDLAELNRLRATLCGDNLPDDDRGSCGLALSKLYDDSGRYEEAFEAAEQGNSFLRRDQRSHNICYDHGAVVANTDETMRIFTTEFFAARKEWGNPSEAPYSLSAIFGRALLWLNRFAQVIRKCTGLESYRTFHVLQPECRSRHHRLSVGRGNLSEVMPIGTWRIFNKSVEVQCV
jgi:tetratricopeptide (TPR) repeat protein